MELRTLIKLFVSVLAPIRGNDKTGFTFNSALHLTNGFIIIHLSMSPAEQPFVCTYAFLYFSAISKHMIWHNCAVKQFELEGWISDNGVMLLELLPGHGRFILYTLIDSTEAYLIR